MSVAVAVSSSVRSDSTQNEVAISGTLTLSSNYGGGSTHGDTMDLSAISPAGGQLPNRVEIYEEPTAGNAPTGYAFIYAKGTTAANGLLVVIQCAGSAAPGAEITQGAAYAAALIAGTANIKFVAWFPRL